jgi:hypothetical protein
LEKDDIEGAFTSPFKIFKSGKYYLLRINVKPNIKVYNETDQIINIDDISSEKHIISIIEIQGIRFTSRNFQIEFELKQAMIVSPDPFLDECFIKKPNKKPTDKEEHVIKNILEARNDLEEPKLDSVPQVVPDIALEAVPDIALEVVPDILEEFDINTFINDSANDLVKGIKQNDLAVSFDLSNTIKTTSENEIEKQNESEKQNEIETENEKQNEIETENEKEIEDLNNIHLEITELEDPNILKEVDMSLTLEKNLETITLKKPNQVYYEIYEKAREKAKEAKKTALQAYLEMKNIKKTYMLDDIDESDSDSEMNDSSDEELDDSY